MINKIKHLRNYTSVGQTNFFRRASEGTRDRALFSAEQSTFATPNMFDDIGNISPIGVPPVTPTIETYTPTDIAQYNALTSNGRVYTKFSMDDKVENQLETVTGGVWSTGLASLTTHFSSSTQTTSQRRYYVDVFNALPSLTGSTKQYTIAYGNALGSGSSAQGQLNDSAAKAIYSQYKQLLLNPNDSRFTTEGSGSTDSIYVITFNRSQLKERLDAGNFEIPLTNITSRDSNATGSVSLGSTVFTLIDDSSTNTSTTTESGRVYNLVSGSLTNGIYNSTAPHYYGVVYPDYGAIILDGDILDAKLGFATNTGSNSEGNNHFALFRSISGSGTITNPATSDLYGFQARNSERIKSTHYFVRVKNSEYNFSNNPSYVTGSVGQIAQPSFINDPKSYITTIGLYNDSSELLAVAKLSQPILKTYQREALIRVKLDF